MFNPSNVIFGSFGYDELVKGFGLQADNTEYRFWVTFLGLIDVYLRRRFVEEVQSANKRGCQFISWDFWPEGNHGAEAEQYRRVMEEAKNLANARCGNWNADDLFDCWFKAQAVRDARRTQLGNGGRNDTLHIKLLERWIELCDALEGYYDCQRGNNRMNRNDQDGGDDEEKA